MAKAAFTFGRFNPPHQGHGLVVDAVKRYGGRNSFIFTSQSQDKKKNPLPFRRKVLYLRKMFSNRGVKIMDDKNIIDVHDAISELTDRGFDELLMVVGDDQVESFKKAVMPYLDQYDLKFFDVVSAGVRNPDAEGVEGLSASKMRQYIAAGDFDAFLLGMPNHVKESDAQKLFNEVRKYMGIREETETYWFDHEEFYLFSQLFPPVEKEDLLESIKDFMGENI